MSTEQSSSSARSRRARTGLLAGAAAVLLVAAAAGTTAVLLDHKSSPHYATLPRPCSLITTATLAKYLPGAKSSQIGSPSTGSAQSGSCSWTGQDRALTMTVVIYGSASAVPALKPVSLSSGSSGTVPGLGDQAMVVAAVATARSAPAARALSLAVRSGNAEIDIFTNGLSSGSTVQPTGMSPADAARQDGLIAAADDALAALADPAAAASRAIAPAAPSPTVVASAPVPGSGPQYTKPRDPCKLVTTRTLARYLPGAMTDPGAGHLSGVNAPAACGWNSGASGWGLSVLVFVSDSGFAGDSETLYQSGIQGATQTTTEDGTKTTPEGTQQVSGVGEQATAVFQSQKSPLVGITKFVELFFWSGNAEVQITFSYVTNSQLATSPPPKRATQVAAVTAVARDVLAVLPRSKR